MDKIREILHKISNRLNNISVIAGGVKEEFRGINLSDKQGLQRKEDIIESLQRIEDNVTSLAGKLEELRGLIKTTKK